MSRLERRARALVILMLFLSVPLSLLMMVSGLRMLYDVMPTWLWLCGCFTVVVACLGLGCLADKNQCPECPLRHGQ